MSPLDILAQNIVALKMFSEEMKKTSQEFADQIRQLTESQQQMRGALATLEQKLAKVEADVIKIRVDTQAARRTTEAVIMEKVHVLALKNKADLQTLVLDKLAAAAAEPEPELILGVEVGPEINEF